MSLLLAVSPVVVSEFSVSVSPSVYYTVTTNGSFTTPKFKANAENFTGELTYSWSVFVIGSQQGNVTINSPTSKETSLTASSFNSNIILALTCEVTDDNDTVSATASVQIQFGSGGIEP